MRSNILLDKLNDYMTIVGYKMRYEFTDGSELIYELKKRNFPHLIGLQKLTDIPLISSFNDSTNRTVSAGFLISRIKKQRFLTDSIVRSSIHFPLIEERYNNFSRENILNISYTDAIVDFNPDLVGSSLRSNYILFEQKNTGYNHLGVAIDQAGNPYIETFFFNQTDSYIRNQNIIHIAKTQIFDKDGSLYLEDNFC